VQLTLQLLLLASDVLQQQQQQQQPADETDPNLQLQVAGVLHYCNELLVRQLHAADKATGSDYLRCTILRLQEQSQLQLLLRALAAPVQPEAVEAFDLLQQLAGGARTAGLQILALSSAGDAHGEMLAVICNVRGNLTLSIRRCQLANRS
jgi:hypothetical protein